MPAALRASSRASLPAKRAIIDGIKSEIKIFVCQRINRRYGRPICTYLFLLNDLNLESTSH